MTSYKIPPSSFERGAARGCPILCQLSHPRLFALSPFCLSPFSALLAPSPSFPIIHTDTSAYQSNPKPSDEERDLHRLHHLCSTGHPSFPSQYGEILHVHVVRDVAPESSTYRSFIKSPLSQLLYVVVFVVVSKVPAHPDKHVDGYPFPPSRPLPPFSLKRIPLLSQVRGEWGRGGVEDVTFRLTMIVVRRRVEVCDRQGRSQEISPPWLYLGCMYLDGKEDWRLTDLTVILLHLHLTATTGPHHAVHT